MDHRGLSRLLETHPGVRIEKAAEVICFPLASCLRHCSLPVAGKEREAPSALLLQKKLAKIPQWAFKLPYGRVVWLWQRGTQSKLIYLLRVGQSNPHRALCSQTTPRASAS